MSKKKKPQLRKANPPQIVKPQKWWQKCNPLLLFSFLMSTLFLLVCSKSSPLYPMNDWVDVNCFFTVGKGILHGIVPYAELYEQKGPVLYFMYAIASLISNKSFFGVFLIEVVTFGLFLYFSGKIAEIFLGKTSLNYVIIAFLAAIIPISKAFAHGGGCEEMCLFMLTYSLYSVLLALHEKRTLTFKEGFLNGIFAAAVLYIKFTMVGFYMGLALFVLLWYLFDGKCLELLKTIGHFLLGVGALSAVVFGYFAIHGAVGDFYEVYFYNNLFLYPQETEGTKWELIKNCLDTTVKTNTSYGWALWLGLLLFGMEIRKHWKGLVMAVLCFWGLVIGTYWGGRGYTYYGLILAAFAVFGLIAIGRALQLADDSKWFGTHLLKDIGTRVCVVILLVFLLLNNSYDKSGNTYLMDYEKDDMPPYRFAKIINTVEDPKILNYGFLDGGFYYAADVLPSTEFFCTLNISVDNMWQSHRNAMLNGEFDFVITRTIYESSYWNPSSLGYELVDQATFYFEGRDFTYYLYQRSEK